MAQNFTLGRSAVPIMKMGGAKVLRAAAQTVATGGAGSALDFDQIEYDDAGFFNPLDPTLFTVPPGMGGRYAIAAWTAYNPNSTGTRSILIVPSFGNPIGTRVPAFATDSGFLSVSTEMELGAGSTVTFTTRQTSGGDLDLVAGFTGASIQRVGLASGTNPTGPITTSALTCNDNVLLGRVGQGMAGTIQEVDYYEGSWQPTLTFDTPGNLSVSYNTQVGYYHRIGSLINFVLRLICTPTHTTASGNVRISLPFVVRNVSGNIPVFSIDLATSTTYPASCTQLFGEASPNTSYFLIGARGSGALSAISVTQFTTGVQREIRMSGSYLTT
jgi:hypothetical protein